MNNEKEQNSDIHIWAGRKNVALHGKLGYARKELNQEEEEIITTILLPMEYRLQQAAYLLLHTENTVQQIGECCGFEDNSYFAKSFRMMYQMTPTEYRRRRFQE